MRRLLISIALALGAFAAVCAMGTVIGSAAGFRWGTDDAGQLAFFTMVAATMVAAYVLVVRSEP